MLRAMGQMHNSHSPAFKAAAARMPVLAHFHRNRPFDIMESDVVAWLVEQPEIRQEVFNMCRRVNSIVYVDGKWMGAETYDNANAKVP